MRKCSKVKTFSFLAFEGLGFDKQGLISPPKTYVAKFLEWFIGSWRYWNTINNIKGLVILINYSYSVLKRYKSECEQWKLKFALVNIPQHISKSCETNFSIINLPLLQVTVEQSFDKMHKK